MSFNKKRKWRNSKQNPDDDAQYAGLMNDSSHNKRDTSAKEKACQCSKPEISTIFIKGERDFTAIWTSAFYWSSKHYQGHQASSMEIQNQFLPYMPANGNFALDFVGP